MHVAYLPRSSVKLAWHSGSVFDCHATDHCSIPGGKCKNCAFRPLQGTVNDLAVDGT